MGDWTHALVIKAYPLLARRVDEGIVVPSVDASRMHQHTVKLVLVPYRAVCVFGEVLVVVPIQI